MIFHFNEECPCAIPQCDVSSYNKIWQRYTEYVYRLTVVKNLISVIDFIFIAHKPATSNSIAKSTLRYQKQFISTDLNPKKRSVSRLLKFT